MINTFLPKSSIYLQNYPKLESQMTQVYRDQKDWHIQNSVSSGILVKKNAKNF